MVSQFGSLGYTIMVKTADLTVVQKTIIDTLHKEGKPQTFIAKEAGCSQSAVSKYVNRKLSGRKKCGRKRCTTNRENRSIMRIVKQNQFKNLDELHKEWTEAGVKASRATTHRRVKEFGYSCRQRRLAWAKEKTAKSTKSWLNEHGVGVLDWPANSSDLNPRESMGHCQEENEKQETKKCRWAEGHCQRNLGFHTTSAVPQTDHLHATPNWGSNLNNSQFELNYWIKLTFPRHSNLLRCTCTCDM